MNKHLRKSASSADKKPSVPNQPGPSADNSLFDRVASILEQARGNVVRTVNTNMVLAYWLIGREIVQELQGGKGRAKYGEKIIEDLSSRLTERYRQGFSVPNIKNFRQFYQAYTDRCGAIGYPTGIESVNTQIPRLLVGELTPIQKSYPLGSELPQGFSSQLTWSHYRALMRVENREARNFYEREAVAGGWDKRVLERQIHSYYFERIQKSKKPEKMLAEGRNLPVRSTSASARTTALLIWSSTTAV
jgi:hypothetical protein